MPPYKPLEQCMRESAIPFMQLFTYELDIDLVDEASQKNLTEYLCDDIRGYEMLARMMCQIYHTETDEAYTTIYNSLHFAKLTTDLVGDYYFELPIADYIGSALGTGHNLGEVIDRHVNMFFIRNETARRYMEIAADSLDASADKRYFDLVARSLGMMWILGDLAMHKTYLEKAEIIWEEDLSVVTADIEKRKEDEDSGE